jgi:hypothetical protein
MSLGGGLCYYYIGGMSSLAIVGYISVRTVLVIDQHLVVEINWVDTYVSTCIYIYEYVCSVGGRVVSDL